MKGSFFYCVYNSQMKNILQKEDKQRLVRLVWTEKNVVLVYFVD